MAIINISKAVLNDRGENTGFTCGYHVVSDVYDTAQGVGFTVKSFVDAAGFAAGIGAAISENFFCPISAPGFPFSEAAQAVGGVTLKTLVEAELIKPGEMDTVLNRSYPFRGYLHLGTIV